MGRYFEAFSLGETFETYGRTITETDLVTFAGMTGDHNPLHQDPEFAKDISPTGGVIAHGMYSMGLASRLLTGWAGGPEKVAGVQVRFSKPWPIDTESTFGGTVTEVTDDLVHVELWGRNESTGETILTGAGQVRR